jgi:outer membrane murein-binding lipoprotein Lpp
VSPDPVWPSEVQAFISAFGPTIAIVGAAITITWRLGRLYGKIDTAKAELQGKVDVLSAKIDALNKVTDNLREQISSVQNNLLELGLHRLFEQSNKKGEEK